MHPETLWRDRHCRKHAVFCAFTNTGGGCYCEPRHGRIIGHPWLPAYITGPALGFTCLCAQPPLVLTPGPHAAWVTVGFVPDPKRVRSFHQHEARLGLRSPSAFGFRCSEWGFVFPLLLPGRGFRL